MYKVLTFAVSIAFVPIAVTGMTFELLTISVAFVPVALAISIATESGFCLFAISIAVSACSGVV